MRAKEYLQQLKKMDIVIQQKIQELSQLKELGGLKGIDYSQEKVKNSQANCANFESVVIKIIDLENEINNEINKFVDKKHDIINKIQGLEHINYIQILYKRYVEYKKFEVISIETNYAYQYIRELHKKGLQEFERTYKNIH